MASIMTEHGQSIESSEYVWRLELSSAIKPGESRSNGFIVVRRLSGMLLLIILPNLLIKRLAQAQHKLLKSIEASVHIQTMTKQDKIRESLQTLKEIMVL